MDAEVTILNKKGEEIKVKKTFPDKESAEDWVVSMFKNERCVMAGCPSLAMVRLGLRSMKPD